VFERPQSGERAIIVHITIHHFKEQATLEEFIELVASAGADTLATITGIKSMPEPSTFVGEGKLAEIADLVVAKDADIVLFNHTLTPAQERNIERALECRVLDRTGVILDIFAQRARSFEGKLQVELAQLKHLSTRLVRGWTHLERQKGGIGLRGPGETQLETDKRLLSERIKHINRRLEKVTHQRELSRKARQRAELPVVSLVGYTNAGKSTLFNHLTNAEIYAADQLFATLDTTVRRISLPNKIPLVLADTVGFIQQLPHDLVAAFRATLEETRNASLLLHIVDVTDEERQLRIEQVNQVLTEIGAQSIPQIVVYNKLDQLSHHKAKLEKSEDGNIKRIWLSAKTGEGVDLLLEALQHFFSTAMTHCVLRIPVQAGHIRSRLFEETLVLDEQFAENGDSLLEMQLQTKHFEQLLKNEPQIELVLLK